MTDSKYFTTTKKGEIFELKSELNSDKKEKKKEAVKKQKRVPLTKEEVLTLLDLIIDHPIVISKAIDATNNKLKEVAWLEITERFNSLISSAPRKPEQVRLKWENLKKATRKRSAKIRRTDLKTREYIPPDETLDKVAAILGSMCDSSSIEVEAESEVEKDEPPIDPLLPSSNADAPALSHCIQVPQTIKIPMLKDEVLQLLELVMDHPVVLNKVTDATNNKLKEVAWLEITDRLNSLISSAPRKPEQVRLKWENLKKAARKRSAKIRSNLKTREYIPPDEPLDKVAAILGSMCDSSSIEVEAESEAEKDDPPIDPLLPSPSADAHGLSPCIQVPQTIKIPMLKEEVLQLLELIMDHPVVLNKATDATNNKLKEVAWFEITERLNSLISSAPRKPEQVRLKWENLKKAARKRSAKIRSNLMRGRKSGYIPPDQALDKVAAILDSTCDGSSVEFEAEVVAEDIKDEPPIDPLMPSPSAGAPDLSPCLQAPLTNKIPSTQCKGKMESQAVSEDIKQSIRDKNQAITAYYDQKRKNEHELFLLKKRKLELEILEIQNKI